MTKSLLICTSSMMAIVFGAASPVLAQNHAQQMHRAPLKVNPCLLGSGASGQCSGAMQVTESVQITTSGEVSSGDDQINSQYAQYAAPVANGTCTQAIVQRVPCDGQWAYTSGQSNYAAPVIYSAPQSGTHLQHQVPHGGNYASAPLHQVPAYGYNDGHPSHSEHMNGNTGHYTNGNGNNGGMANSVSVYGNNANGYNSYSTNNSYGNAVYGNTVYTDTGYVVSPAAPNYGPGYAPNGYAPNGYAPIGTAPNGYAPNGMMPLVPGIYAQYPSMPSTGISPSFFYGGTSNGVGFNMQTGYSGGGSSYYSGGSRFSGIAGRTRLTPPGQRTGPNPPPQPPPPPPPPN